MGKRQDIHPTGGMTTKFCQILIKTRWNDNDSWEDADDGWTAAPSDYNQDRKVQRRQVSQVFGTFTGHVKLGPEGHVHSSHKELFSPGQEAAGARPSRAPPNKRLAFRMA